MIKSRPESKHRTSPPIKLRYFGQRVLSILYPWRQLDWVLFLAVVTITMFGGLLIYSTELPTEHSYSYQHWTVCLLGCPLLLFLSRYRYQSLIKWHWLVYTLTNLLLIAVIAIGVTANGAQSWLAVAGVHIQPSEFSKIALVITLASLLHERSPANLATIFRILAITAIPWGLILLQPDLGTSLVFGAIVMAMLYWANANSGWLLLMVSPLFSAILYHVYLPGWLFWVLIVAGIAWLTLPLKLVSTLVSLVLNLGAVEIGNLFWEALKEYQKDRLVLFLNPEQDPLGGGYHLIQSRIAIGAGKFWGQGWNQGTQTMLDFIPEQHTDFIFAAVGEQFGFFGSIIVVAILWLICMRLIWIACNAQDNFGSLLAIGILAIIAFQSIVNISMTMGLAPITGIPLPWVSYGRSALLSNFIGIGLVESVANCREDKNKKFY